VAGRQRGRGRGRRLALIAALALLAGGCVGGDDQGRRADVVIVASRLFDGERMIEDAAVAIRDGVIVYAGSREELSFSGPLGLALRDDTTILPGLIDLHTHGLGYGQVRSAVTTVRDLGTDDRNLPLDERATGPRVLAAGPLITAPRGYPIPLHGPRVAHVVRTPDGARRYVRSLANRGAAAIKVSLQFGFPVVTFAVLRAIVEEAHGHDLRVTAHVGDGNGARMARRAGVDELAHMPCGQEPELMRELARAGIEIVGTLHVIELVVACREARFNAAAFVAAGGKLLYGSDYGVPGIPAGVDIAELRRLAESGLGALGALRAATSEAAKVLPVEGLGRLVEGAPADLVVVDGDPTRNLELLRDPLLVLRDGVSHVGPKVPR
jgi:imidazolonepropionase-like amidohydrolase